MVLDTGNTTVAYRCPACGCAVMSGINLFALSGDMLKLKCDCKESEMTIVRLKEQEEKIQVTVPCMFCPNPHRFTLSRNLFFGKDLFTMSCPYSDFTLCCVGDENAVKAEMSRSEYELIKLLEENGIEDLETLHQYMQNETGEDGDRRFPTDPQIRDIVMFVIKDLDEEGKIRCGCTAEEEHTYDVQIEADGIRVSCPKCGASRVIPTDSSLAAQEFLNIDRLDLLENP